MNSIFDNSRGTDDLFSNSSVQTVMENIDFSLVLEKANVLPSSNLTKNLHENKPDDVPVVTNIDLHKADPGTVMEKIQKENSIIKEITAADESFIAYHIVMQVCNFPLKLYCPFCCNNYKSESKLKGHIKNEHATHLKRVSVDNNTDSLHSCQFCHARFYISELVIKHIVQYHQDNVITMFQEVEPNKYIICRFCPYMVLIEHKQHLLAHVEKNHLTEFKTFIDEKFTQTAQSDKLQYNLDMKNSSIPNLNNLFMQMSTKEDKETKKASVDQSECSSSSQFIHWTGNQLLDDDGNFVVSRKVSEIKNVRTGSELPIRRKLKFDLPEIHDLKKSNKENIISCSTNMKLVTKCIPKPSQIKQISTWKSVFSFKKKQTYRNKSILKLVTSAPNTMNYAQTDIRNTEYDKHISVTNKMGEAKAKVTTSMKEEKYIAKKYSVADTGDALHMSNKDVKAVSSKTHHPTILEMKKDSFCSWAPPVDTLKQFECAICLDGFDNNINLLTHIRKQHTGPLKLLQPSYKCGQCEAKFYENSYLIRHCRFHHTPRCLKNELPT